MNWFKSYYDRVAYSPGWYGTMRYAPAATILLYNDIELYCIGYMESELPSGIIPLTEEEATAIIKKEQLKDVIPAITKQRKLSTALETQEVWIGSKLAWRWESEIVESVKELEYAR